MKRFVVISFALLTVISAHAQTGLYVKGGVSLNSLSGKDVLTEFNEDGMALKKKNGMGYDVAFGFQKSLPVLPDLYLGAEVGFGTRGVMATLNGSETIFDETVRFDMSTRMLQHAVKFSPLQVGYRLSVLSPLVFDFHAGVYGSYDLAGKSTAKVTVGYQGESESRTESVSMSEYGDDFRRYDVGINPGITVWYGRIGVDFTYQRGFIALFKDEDAFAQNLHFRLAFRF